jgi:hypothetical protein
MKKLLLIILSLFLLLTFVSCKDRQGAPAGMKLASNRSIVDYSLYVPEEWLVDEASVFTRAHSVADITSVSVYTFALTEDTDIASWWTGVYEPSIKVSLDNYALIEGEVKGAIDGVASLSYIVSSVSTDTLGEVQYKHKITVVKSNSKMYVIWYCSAIGENTNYYDTNLSTLDKILDAFAFSEIEPPKENEGVKYDKNTPEGMKLASNKKVVLYSLYVPSDWTVAQSDAMTLAYVSEQNKSSVSVMQWNLTEQTKTIDLWWSDYHKKELQNSFDTFTVLEEGIEGEIDGIASKSYTYTVTISGTTYKYYVTAVIDQGSIHLITYTSTEALYDETLSTVKDQILANMKFN